jgi:hypothetical protein
MEPAISVLLVTPEGVARLRESLDSLRAQSARDRIELVVVTQSLDRLGADDADLAGFARVEVVEHGPFPSSGAAIAAGVRAARAPVVAYVEEHAFPEPGWGEALIAAHEGPWTAVGCALDNANPGSAVSWASLFTDFGPWLERSAGEVDRLPPHQTSYKRADLLEYGEELDHLLEVESSLHRALRRDGRRLYFEPRARVRHLNPSLITSYARAEFEGGRMFGSQRVDAEVWSAWRRVLYLVGAPLIPFVRLGRLVTDLRAGPSARPGMLTILPPMLVGLVAHTVGECAAYAGGPGDSARHRMSFELDRRSHLRPEDS